MVRHTPKEFVINMNTPILLSIQVGKPARRGGVGSDDPMQRPWLSGIFKEPVSGAVRLNSLNLEGDGQADLKNHGGLFRAVLGYSADHYPIWREELNKPDLPYGAFGENFTISGLDENKVSIGDIFAIGDIRLQVTQPRQPCWKLARRWQLKDLTARVDTHGWGGWYHRVLQEGMVEAGVPVMLLERPYPAFTIAFVSALMTERIENPQAAYELSQIEPLTPTWREAFAQRAAQSA
jgi:MOSC domain-containing protein YiiM